MQEDTKVVNNEELKKKASEKPMFNILVVSDKDSYLTPFRGDSVFDTFSQFYAKLADITVTKTSSKILAKMNVDEFAHYNILWLDNVIDYGSTKVIADVQRELLMKIDPNWKEIITSGGDESGEYIASLSAKKQNVLKVIYALDEFVWEAPVGRGRDIRTVKNIETFIDLSDVVVVPTPELREVILAHGIPKDPNKDIYVIPTGVSIEFFPLFKGMVKNNRNITDTLMEKPRLLIKGLSIPSNVQQFIVEQYKKYDITICSVGEIDDHILGLMQAKKVNHIYHWANPYVNSANLVPTYAIERDGGYDFVLHCKPNSVNGNMYEICLGDEDILMSIAYGALPFCGVNHIGYDEEHAGYLGIRCGVQFGKDTTSKTLNEMIRARMVPVKFNEEMGKARSLIDSRLTLSPMIMGRYFTLFLGKELAQARATLAREVADKMDAESAIADAEATAISTDK